MSQPLLLVEDLSLSRNGRRILRRVDLGVCPGQMHILLGLNGSGKSSLAATLMGCDRYVPDAGRILFEGQDLAGLSITERARLGITLAWQEPARFEGVPHWKVRQPGNGRCKSRESFRRAEWIDALYAVAVPQSLAERLDMRQIHSVPDEAIALTVDISSVWETKLAAMHCHATQTSASPMMSAPAERQRLFFGREYFVRAACRDPKMDFMSEVLKDDLL